MTFFRPADLPQLYEQLPIDVDFDLSDIKS